MTHHKKFKNESQDARRHDQQDVAHPYEKKDKSQGKIKQNPIKSSDSNSRK